MDYGEIERSEPALLAGLYTGVAGLLALLAANFSLPHDAAVAVGMSASQALLVRPTVVTPKSIDELVAPGDSSGTIAEIIGAAAATPRPDEPVAMIGTLTFLAGFLVQLLAGVDMTSAFVSAAGLAGVQTIATRSRVYSPASGKTIAALSLTPDTPEEKGRMVEQVTALGAVIKRFKI
jgi:hypothetical protein